MKFHRGCASSEIEEVASKFDPNKKYNFRIRLFNSYKLNGVIKDDDNLLELENGIAYSITELQRNPKYSEEIDRLLTYSFNGMFNELDQFHDKISFIYKSEMSSDFKIYFEDRIAYVDVGLIVRFNDISVKEFKNILEVISEFHNYTYEQEFNVYIKWFDSPDCGIL